MMPSCWVPMGAEPRLLLTSCGIHLLSHHLNDIATSGCGRMVRSMAPGCYPHGMDDNWTQHCTMTKWCEPCVYIYKYYAMYTYIHMCDYVYIYIYICVYIFFYIHGIIQWVSFKHMLVQVSVNMFQQHRCVLLNWYGMVQLALLRLRLSVALALRTAAEMWPSGPTSTLVGSVRLPQRIVG